MADTPRAFWPMQESSGLPQDLSGNALHMTGVAGTPDYLRPGPMAVFAIRCAGGEGFSRNTVISTVVDNLTIEMWISVEAIGNPAQTIFYNGNSGANGWGVITRDTFGTTQFEYLCGGVALGAPSVTFLDATWTHLVVRRDLTQWSYLINGAVDTANAGATGPNVPGGALTSILGSGSFQAAMAYLAVYETPLSNARIQAHYAEALAPDDPGASIAAAAALADYYYS